jgi:hypothetical protein
LKLLDSGAAAERLVIDLYVRMQLVVFGKPALIERSGKGCSGALQGDVVIAVGDRAYEMISEDCEKEPNEH